MISIITLVMLTIFAQIERAADLLFKTGFLKRTLAQLRLFCKNTDRCKYSRVGTSGLVSSFTRSTTKKLL